MIQRVIRQTSRYILGLVFIYSGFVKAVDPLGSAYKFGDYFQAFHLGFLDFLALPLSVFLSCFELVLGLALILAWRKRATAWLLLAFMTFFTLLTLILALFDPVSDCGCFGDALILTNWQTFLKNVVLMVFVFLLLYPDGLRRKAGSGMQEWGLLALVYLLALGFSFWNYRHLPLVDFRPYDLGTVIIDEMEIPEDAPVDQYETLLVYRNTLSGKEEEFNIENYPRDTVQWSFVNSESRLIKKGYEPPIHDFAIMDENGDDIVDRILDDGGYSLLMLSHDLEKADQGSLVSAGQWAALERLAGDFHFYAVSASTTEIVESTTANLDLPYPVLAGDEIMLKTMIRSNPGYMLIHRGCIVGKWGFRDFPDLGKVNPEAVDMVQNMEGSGDEERLVLMEAGIYDELNFEVLDFGDMIPRLHYTNLNNALEGRAVWIFVLVVALVLLLLKYTEKRNKL